MERIIQNIYYSHDDGKTLVVRYKDKRGNIKTEAFKHDKLDSCPFCGDKANIEATQVLYVAGTKIRCRGCGVMIIELGTPPFGQEYPNNLKEALFIAVKKWNRRRNKG